MATLGERIKQVRGDDSHSVFAERTGISKSSIGGYERGENSPSAEAILKICDSYNISVEWLLTGKGPMHRVETTCCPPPSSKPYERALECPQCVKLERELDLERHERRELSVENRELLRENGDLRVQIAILEERLKIPKS